MKKLLAGLLIAAMMMSTVACGGSAGSQTGTDKPAGTEAVDTGDAGSDAAGSDAANTEGKYENAVAVLAAALNGMSAKDELPIVGGSGETMTDGAPASVSVTDTDLFTYTLFIPEDVQSSLTDAADMMHMMNANTFTAVAIKVDGKNNSDVMKAISESLQSAEFMCGAPEKFLFADVDGYVVYSFGEATYVESLKAAVEGLENLNSEVEIIDYAY